MNQAPIQKPNVESRERPSDPVNPEIQCMTVGCGTALWPDGTCPRCYPMRKRPLDEQRALAEAMGDRVSLARVEHEERARGIVPARPAREVDGAEADGAEADGALSGSTPTSRRRR